jgi:hypothetical protein
VAKVLPDGGRNRALQLSVHLNNCRVHSSNESKQFSPKFSRYCSSSATQYDLAPSNFWLFGDINISLAGCVFNDIDEILESVIEFWMRFSPPNRILFFTIGLNERNGCESTMETTITSRQHPEFTRKTLSGGPRPVLLNDPRESVQSTLLSRVLWRRHRLHGFGEVTPPVALPIVKGGPDRYLKSKTMGHPIALRIFGNVGRSICQPGKDEIMLFRISPSLKKDISLFSRTGFREASNYRAVKEI